jgi:hypothetical protein
VRYPITGVRRVKRVDVDIADDVLECGDSFAAFSAWNKGDGSAEPLDTRGNHLPVQVTNNPKAAGRCRTPKRKRVMIY